MKPTLFISDLHLEDSVPDRTAWLMAFLEGPAREAQSLYILGDLFEFWIGDDALSPTAQQVAVAIAALTASGVSCFFQHGNRDFLLGAAYASAAGMELLPETCVIDLYGKPTLLLHGDTLCTDDVAYQAFRQQVRDPAWQAGVLALSIPERLDMAKAARDASSAHTGSTAMAIMDVNPDAVAEAYRQHRVRRIIHGHTHRPAHHLFEVDSENVERIVLADWFTQGSYLQVSPAGVDSFQL